ncbi:MAG: dihydrofolate reductase [Pseudomonadales bacterium]|nr:dihydrofolate reductase [Pseudomonadales bacterium]
MKVALIWAMADNGCIGNKNGLPWHLPGDLRYFKQVTMGKPIIMGRKTWDSIGRPLPGRKNIIISRDPAFQLEGARVVHSLEEAFRVAAAFCQQENCAETVVMGGAEIYRLALPWADRLYLTRVHATVEGDVFFPELDLSAWQEIKREDHRASAQNPYDYSFCVLEK